MGRQRKIITIATIVAIAPICMSSFVTAQNVNVAHAAPAQIAQMTPVISQQAASARDALTFNEDVTITNGCIDRGATKAECLCVTRISKYELSLADYRATATLFRSSDKAAAKTRMTRLISDPDFALRCANATSYFEADKPRRKGTRR